MMLKVMEVHQESEEVVTYNPIYKVLPTELIVSLELVVEQRDRKQQLLALSKALNELPTMKIIDAFGIFPEPEQEPRPKYGNQARVNELVKQKDIITQVIEEIRETGNLSVGDVTLPLDTIKIRVIDLLMELRRTLRQRITQLSYVYPGSPAETGPKPGDIWYGNPSGLVPRGWSVRVTGFSNDGRKVVFEPLMGVDQNRRYRECLLTQWHTHFHKSQGN